MKDQSFERNSLLEDDPESLKSIERRLRKQNAESKDAKDFGPYWLEGIQGTLAEERRQSRPNKQNAYNRSVADARRRSRKSPLKAIDCLQNPEAIDIKLSELWARYPSTTISFEFSIQKICRSKPRLLRNFVIWYIFYDREIPKYIEYEIEGQLDSILREGESFPKIPEELYIEILVLREMYLLHGREFCRILVQDLYSEDNLERWRSTITRLLETTDTINIPLMKIKEKVRKRGYRGSRSNNKKSKDQRGEVAMSSEARTLEEIKQDILRKQALLFERRLDDFLSLTDPELPKSEKQKIFHGLVESNSRKEPTPEEVESHLWDQPSE